MDSTGCDIHARPSNGCSECNRQPTREQMRCDPAQAMGWKLVHDGYGISPDSTTVPQPRKLPNPFDSADDSRALVTWLAKQGEIVQEKFESLLLYEHVSDLNEELGLGLFYLTAPLPVIAEAAWGAIQPTK